MSSVLLYWHTLKHLKPAQFWYRLWYLLYKPKPDFLPKLRSRTFVGKWQCAPRANSMPAENTFRFLNQTHVISAPANWNRPDVGDLWLFNAHYFDDLNAEDALSRSDWHRRLLDHWVIENPPGEGIGWHPYPTSLRIVNWVKWLLAPNEPLASLQASLPTQANWLSKQLEYHLQANHLWANAKALIFAGTCYEGAEADRWLAKGCSLFARQLQIQILPDGGHFERSPMYHAIMLEDMLDLLQLNDRYPSLLSPQLLVDIKQRVPHMFAWLGTMCHPDGDIAFFNDATLGIAPTLHQLKQYAHQTGYSELVKSCTDIAVLSDSGYVSVTNEHATVIADVGEIGPDFQPGHAHGDTLSFELSLFSSRFIVNRGIDRYSVDSERLRQRGTAAHSTVEVDGQNSSEVWSGFRVARRARPFNLKTAFENNSARISCSHDGYRRLPGRVTHRREWLLESESLEVVDALDGAFSTAIARFYLHPDVEVLQKGASRCELQVAGKKVSVSVEGAALQIIAVKYHPGFNIAMDSQCLELTFSSNKCVTRFEWEVH